MTKFQPSALTTTRQGLGTVPALVAADLLVGDRLVANYGYTETIVSIEPKGKQSLTVTTTTDGGETTYARTMRCSTRWPIVRRETTTTPEEAATTDTTLHFTVEQINDPAFAPLFAVRDNGTGDLLPDRYAAREHADGAANGHLDAALYLTLAHTFHDRTTWADDSTDVAAVVCDLLEAGDHSDRVILYLLSLANQHPAMSCSAEQAASIGALSQWDRTLAALPTRDALTVDDAPHAPEEPVQDARGDTLAELVAWADAFTGPSGQPWPVPQVIRDALARERIDTIRANATGSRTIDEAMRIHADALEWALEHPVEAAREASRIAALRADPLAPHTHGDPPAWLDPNEYDDSGHASPIDTDQDDEPYNLMDAFWTNYGHDMDAQAMDEQTDDHTAPGGDQPIASMMGRLPADAFETHPVQPARRWHFHPPTTMQPGDEITYDPETGSPSSVRDGVTVAASVAKVFVWRARVP